MLAYLTQPIKKLDSNYLKNGGNKIPVRHQPLLEGLQII
jgi:hypothetical protein